MRAPPVAAALGATLYVPATRTDLAAVLWGGRVPDLRSAVLCLEDSVRTDRIDEALDRLAELLDVLPAAPATRPYVFVRPREPAMLDAILSLSGAEALDGFVLPKATVDTLPAWLERLTHTHHAILPTLETRETFDPVDVRRLRDALSPIQSRVPCVRIGGNDLLQLLGARRSTHRTIYDGPLGPLIASLVGAFAPQGFALSAPVVEGWGDSDLLLAEVERDLEHGMITKTAIHPAQVGPIQSAYAVSAADHGAAQSILCGDAAAVYARGRVMQEPATHRAWAVATLDRAKAFGVHRPA